MRNRPCRLLSGNNLQCARSLGYLGKSRSHPSRQYMARSDVDRRHYTRWIPASPPRTKYTLGNPLRNRRSRRERHRVRNTQRCPPDTWNVACRPRSTGLLQTRSRGNSLGHRDLSRSNAATRYRGTDHCCSYVPRACLPNIDRCHHPNTSVGLGLSPHRSNVRAHSLRSSDCTGWVPPSMPKQRVRPPRKNTARLLHTRK